MKGKVLELFSERLRREAWLENPLEDWLEKQIEEQIERFTEGYRRGFREGFRKGQITVYARFVNDGRFTPGRAVAELGITPEEFRIWAEELDCPISDE